MYTSIYAIYTKCTSYIALYWQCRGSIGVELEGTLNTDIFITYIRYILHAIHIIKLGGKARKSFCNNVCVCACMCACVCI